jgi:hypothetical protein
LVIVFGHLQYAEARSLRPSLNDWIANNRKAQAIVHELMPTEVGKKKFCLLRIPLGLRTLYYRCNFFSAYFSTPAGKERLRLPSPANSCSCNERRLRKSVQTAGIFQKFLAMRNKNRSQTVYPLGGELKRAELCAGAGRFMSRGFWWRRFSWRWSRRFSGWRYGFSRWQIQPISATGLCWAW